MHSIVLNCSMYRCICKSLSTAINAMHTIKCSTKRVGKRKNHSLSTIFYISLYFTYSTKYRGLSTLRYPWTGQVALKSSIIDRIDIVPIYIRVAATQCVDVLILLLLPLMYSTTIQRYIVQYEVEFKHCCMLYFGRNKCL